MIDPENEEILTMAEAAKLAPNRPHVGSVWRWGSVGLKGVKLETICFGGRCTRTSRQALARFFERVTAAKNREVIASRPNGRRQAEQQASKKQLRDAGLID